MKKLALLAAASFLFVACDKKTEGAATKDTTAVVVDTAKKDTAKKDTAKKDSTKKDTAAKKDTAKAKK
jgi:hypothetical protein